MSFKSFAHKANPLLRPIDTGPKNPNVFKKGDKVWVNIGIFSHPLDYLAVLTKDNCSLDLSQYQFTCTELSERIGVTSEYKWRLHLKTIRHA